MQKLLHLARILLSSYRCCNNSPRQHWMPVPLLSSTTRYPAGFAYLTIYCQLRFLRVSF